MTQILKGITKPGDVKYTYFDSPRDALKVKFLFYGHDGSQKKCARVDIVGCILGKTFRYIITSMVIDAQRGEFDEIFRLIPRATSLYIMNCTE